MFRRILLMSLGALMLAIGGFAALRLRAPEPRRYPVRDITVSGETRCYRILAPTAVTEGRRAPLVVVFGGVGVTAEAMARLSQLDEYAEERGACVVYPEPIRGMWMMPLPDSRSLVGNRDLEFFDAICHRLLATYPIDPKRVYVAGISNGAEFASYLASQRSGVIAAIVVHSGGLPTVLENGIHATRKYPVLLIAGIADTQSPVPYVEACKDAYKREGHPVKFVLAEGVGHTWATTLNPMIWGFLEQHPLN